MLLHSSNILSQSESGGHRPSIQALLSDDEDVTKEGGNEQGDSSSKSQDRRNWMAKQEGEQMHRELHSLNVGEYAKQW